MASTSPEFYAGAIAPLECVKEGWALIKDRYWLFFGITLVGILIGGAVPIVLTTIPLSPLRRDSVIDYGRKARLEAAWDGMNAAISRLAAQKSGVVVLSAAAVSGRVIQTQVKFTF